MFRLFSVLRVVEHMNKYVVIAAVASAFSSSSVGAQVVLTFDDLVAGPLSTQYQAQGATFAFPLVRGDDSKIAEFVVQRAFVRGEEVFVVLSI